MLILIAVSDFIPGLIHVFKDDGGAKSIANFTQYDTCKQEILWAFNVFGTF